jgi:2-isopropylmalate synthase
VKHIEIYDTTLRDGSQREGVSFSVVEKLKIARRIDELGVQYIEGGWPGSNPKDSEFFLKAKDIDFKNAKLVAFGSTRSPNKKAKNDANLKALLDSGAEIVTLVGKCSAAQVKNVLGVSAEENLNMVADSIVYMKKQGVKVFFDAEHFFDGYKDDAAYAIKVLKTAEKAGAEMLVLCDTNGGSMPTEVTLAIKEVKKALKMPLGIHAHNDAELAVANTLAAVETGVKQLQGTINGYGERCGNTNLCSVLPLLKLKMGIDVVSDEQIAKLTKTAHYIDEMANLSPNPFMPYIGTSAFSHKAGLHVDGMGKWEGSYQHIDPKKVGNEPKTLISELAGRANILNRAKELGIELELKGEETKNLLEHVKLLESRGFQYENAEASFDLLVQRARPDYKAPFELVDFMVIVEKRRRAPTRRKVDDQVLAEAMVKVRVNGEVRHTVAEGSGPINALDRALRKALKKFYPIISKVELADFKVRLIGETSSTASVTRVLVESTDGNKTWNTVGSSENIIEAGWLALADSLEYWLLKN